MIMEETRKLDRLEQVIKYYWNFKEPSFYNPKITNPNPIYAVGAIVDIPEISGFKEMEPMEQFIAQVDLCADCTTGCLKGLANVKVTDFF